MIKSSKYNLLGHPDKLFRDVSIRLKDKELNREKALKFDVEYFDGPRSQGYGGYVYDGRWKTISQKIIKKYNLSSFGNFLDVGCGKGFLMKDMKDINPKINVFGLDISQYAKDNSMESVKSNITIGNCCALPYEDNFFDASVAINTKNKKNIFIQVDAYEDVQEKDLFEIWMLTAKTYLMPSEWLEVFDELDYKGDYFWTNLGFKTKV